MTYKHCNKCNQIKHINLFTKDKRRPNSVGSECKSCAVLRANKWISENRKKHAEHVAKWTNSNKEKCNRIHKKYVENNRDKINERQRLHREKNPEYYLKSVLNYAKRNPEKIKENNAKRRAKKRSATVKVSKNIIEKLKILQKNKCPCCNNILENEYHLDHIIPLALGGSHEDSNLQLLKPSCNQKKSKKHPIDYMQSKGFLL